MPTITLDGATIPALEVAGENLEEMLLSLMEHPRAVNRLVVEVRLNGLPYSEDAPHAALEVERETIQSLELSTSSAEDLCLHFLREGPKLVKTLNEAIGKITENFRLDDEAEANEHFLRFLESLHLLLIMLDHTSRIMDLGEEVGLLEGESLSSFLKRLAGIMDRIIQLQEDGDWIYLADLLEYEVSPELERLGGLLPLMNKTGH